MCEFIYGLISYNNIHIYLSFLVSIRHCTNYKCEMNKIDMALPSLLLPFDVLPSLSLPLHACHTQQCMLSRAHEMERSVNRYEQPFSCLGYEF